MYHMSAIKINISNISYKIRMGIEMNKSDCQTFLISADIPWFSYCQFFAFIRKTWRVFCCFSLKCFNAKLNSNCKLEITDLSFFKYTFTIFSKTARFAERAAYSDETTCLRLSRPQPHHTPALSMFSKFDKCLACIHITMMGSAVS